MKFIILTLLTIISCNKPTSEMQESNFDSIEHYSLDSGSKFKNYISEPKNYLDSINNRIKIERFPENIRDTLFIKKLELIGFNKKLVSDRNFNAIEKLITHPNKADYSAACVPIYRVTCKRIQPHSQVHFIFALVSQNKKCLPFSNAYSEQKAELN